MVIDVNLDPTLGSETGKIRPCIIVTNNIYNEKVPVIQVVPLTSWNEKKSLIKTNVEIQPSLTNGLDRKSIADCLQTRPIDKNLRIVNVRGKMSELEMRDINDALLAVFNLYQI
jgi:mRNA interferase MazF